MSRSLRTSGGTSSPSSDFRTAHTKNVCVPAATSCSSEHSIHPSAPTRSGAPLAPSAVAIPCHRVVRKGRGLSGYRWGVARKQVLIEREAAQAAA